MVKELKSVTTVKNSNASRSPPDRVDEGSGPVIKQWGTAGTVANYRRPGLPNGVATIPLKPTAAIGMLGHLPHFLNFQGIFEIQILV